MAAVDLARAQRVVFVQSAPIALRLPSLSSLARVYLAARKISTPVDAARCALSAGIRVLRATGRGRRGQRGSGAWRAQGGETRWSRRGPARGRKPMSPQRLPTGLRGHVQGG